MGCTTSSQTNSGQQKKGNAQSPTLIATTTKHEQKEAPAAEVKPQLRVMPTAETDQPLDGYDDVDEVKKEEQKGKSRSVFISKPMQKLTGIQVAY